MARELIIDNFAGGGGASTGIEWAMGRSPDIAINHNPEAVAMHKLNHPTTKHYCEDVWQVDPAEATRGRPVGLAWFSPDCTHFSKAKGGKPKSNKIRGLAWIVYRWAKAVKPRVMFLENVEEFEDWGPLLDTGLPDPNRIGFTFRRWWKQLENLGYKIECRQLKACDYGAPTSRKRLFVIARCDGKPIRWPEATHGAGLQPYRTAAEIIDWSLECPSIFTRKRPLAAATMRRIAHGVMRYVVNAEKPYVVMTMRGTSDAHINASSQPADEPLRTISAGGTHHALAVPTLIQTSYGERKGQAPRVPGLHKPIGTLMAQGQKHALVAAFLAKHYGGVVGQPLTKTIGTITGTDHHSLVQAFLLKYYGSDQNPQIDDPLHTITAKHRFGLVTVEGEKYTISDIGMRMLQPHELFRAQGFGDDVKLRGTKTSQVRLCGNSVSPPVAAAIVRANMFQQIGVAEAA